MLQNNETHKLPKIPEQWELCNLEMIFSFYLRVGNQRKDLILSNNSISHCQLLLNLTFAVFTAQTGDSRDLAKNEIDSKFPKI